MICDQKHAFSIVAAALGLLAPSTASAFTLSHLSSDDAYNALLQNEAFIAEGRIGDNIATPGRTYELDIHTIEDSATNGEESVFTVHTLTDFAWTNDVAQTFTLVYDAVSNLVSYTVGSKTLTYNPTNPFTDILIRTRAATAGSSIKVDNLVLDGVSIDDSSFAQESSGGLDYLRIEDVPTSFRLSGQSTLSWGSTIPNESNLAYQIKVVTTDDTTQTISVPEPSVTLGLTLGAIALILNRHRKQRG